MSDEVDFLHADKGESFLQVYDAIIIDGYDQAFSKYSRYNTFVTSLQYLRKEVRYGVHFLHAEILLHTSQFLQVSIIVFDGSGLTEVAKVPKIEIWQYFCHTLRKKYC